MILRIKSFLDCEQDPIIFSSFFSVVGAVLMSSIAIDECNLSNEIFSDGRSSFNYLKISSFESSC